MRALTTGRDGIYKRDVHESPKNQKMNCVNVCVLTRKHTNKSFLM